MADFAVQFGLEAADLAAAEKAVGEWKATPGAVLHAITEVVQASPMPPAAGTGGLPQEVPPTGDVGDALETAEGFALYSLAPESVVHGVGEVQLHVHGLGYTTMAVIVFAGTELATAHVSDAELYCTIDAGASGHAPGTFDVLVRQDGKDTKTLPFTITP
jgi:hypothetical protein